MAVVIFNPPVTPITNVPSWFISDYMPQASSGHIKTYFYFLMLYQNQSTDIVLEDIAKKLDMLYSELISSLDYWHQLGVLTFESKSKEAFSLAFSESQPSIVTSTNTPHTPASVSTTSEELPAVRSTFLQQTRPHYTKEEIMLYKEQNHSISTLFKICEKYLGRLLSPADQQIIYGCYDWLTMPLDLIEFLVEYCASNNHTQIRYIEKVALGWHEQGIKTVEDAKEQVATTTKYRKIFKALGMSSETITKHQRDILDKWLIHYQFSLEIILEGCNRTVAFSSNPTLNYLGSILENWYKNGVKTLKDIEILDKQHNRTSTSPVTPKKIVNKNPYFTSTYSHNWDLDELERKEREYINQKVYGGNA